MNKKAIVLISGGLDSTTVLALARSQGFECFALSFDYGQRHRFELDAAARIAKALRAYRHEIFKIPLNTIGGSALTNPNIAVPDYTGHSTIPVTYVPARNTIFLSIALGFAEVEKADAIFIGASSVDYSGYPDCRPEYFKAFETLMNLATKSGVEGTHCTLQTPLLYLTKAQTIQLGVKLGVDYSMTVSCYSANQKGEACGQCDSCALRIKGFHEAGVSDPTKYSINHDKR